MLTTHANNPMETANNATNNLLATNPPGYTRGRLAAEQVGGVVSSKGREQSNELEPGMWRYTDATGTRIGKLPTDVWAFVERADAKFGIVTDTERWVRLKAEYGITDEDDARRVAIVAKQRKGK